MELQPLQGDPWSRLLLCGGCRCEGGRGVSGALIPYLGPSSSPPVRGHWLAMEGAEGRCLTTRPLAAAHPCRCRHSGGDVAPVAQEEEGEACRGCAEGKDGRRAKQAAGTKHIRSSLSHASSRRNVLLERHIYAAPPLNLFLCQASLTSTSGSKGTSSEIQNGEAKKSA